MKDKIREVFAKAVEKPKPPKLTGRHTDENKKFINRMKGHNR